MAAPAAVRMEPRWEARTPLQTARNRLAGTVSRVQVGAVNSEVVIELPGGGAIASIITNESAGRLGLKAGTKASALFKASSVIIGVPS